MPLPVKLSKAASEVEPLTSDPYSLGIYLVVVPGYRERSPDFHKRNQLCRIHDDLKEPFFSGAKQQHPPIEGLQGAVHPRAHVPALDRSHEPTNAGRQARQVELPNA